MKCSCVAAAGWVSMMMLASLALGADGKSLFDGPAQTPGEVPSDEAAVVAPATRRAVAEPWRVQVNFKEVQRAIPKHYAAANVNDVAKMLGHGEAFDESVRQLGITFLRFQVPLGPKWDYKKISEWKEKDFASLDAAVETARTKWGAQELMFGIHRIVKPVDENGRMKEEDFDAYADACAALVRRYAPPGHVRVKYWEPFNEWDGKRLLESIKKHGQDYRVVVKAYQRAAEKMKAVNPEIIVGGPALTTADAAKVAMLLEKVPDAGFISWHDYPTGSPEDSDAKVLRAVTSAGRFQGGAMGLAETLKKHGRADTPMYLNEYQTNWHSWQPMDARAVNAFAGVFTASVLAALSTTPTEALFIHEIEGPFYGIIGIPSRDKKLDGEHFAYDAAGGVRVRPAGWVYKWFNELARGEWVSCRAALPEADETSERGPLLNAVAWRDGARRGIMLVNKDEILRSVDVNVGETVASSGYALPVEIRTIAGGRAVVGRTAGTRKGILRLELLPMSVVFVSY